MLSLFRAIVGGCMLYNDILKKIQRKKQADNAIVDKDENWLTASELSANEIVGKIERIIHWMQIFVLRNGDTIAGYIEYRRSGTQTILCLNIDKIQLFCSDTGLKTVNKNIVSSGKKDKKYMTACELSDNEIYSGHLRIHKKMKNMVLTNGGPIPGFIEYRQSGSNKILCLNYEKIDEFCKKEEPFFERRDKSIPEWTKGWLKASELAGKKVVGDSGKIYGKLKDYYEIYENLGSVRRLKKGPKITLYMYDDEKSIDLFCERMGLERLYREKDTNWLNAQDLAAKEIIGTVNKIRIMLEKSYEENGRKNCEFIKKSKMGVPYLFRGAISRFCKENGLKQICETIQKCDENWLPVSKLISKEIIGKRGTILSCMEILSETEYFKNYIKYLRCGPNVQLYLYRDKIDDFCKKTGLKRKDKNIQNWDENWISGTKLSEVEIMADRKVVLEHMNKLISDNGGKSISGFVEFRCNGSNGTLYLHKSKISEFCKITGLKSR